MKEEKARGSWAAEGFLDGTPEDLHQSEKRLQHMLSLVPDLVSIHDREMNIVYSNWNGFGAVPKERRILQTKCYKTYRDYDTICPDCQAKDVLRSRQPLRKEVQLSNGTWVDLRVIPLLDAKGNAELFVEWVRDISELKQTEDELKRHNKLLEGLIDGTSDVLAIQNPDFTIERYNKAGYRMLGLTLQEMRGKKCYELLGRSEECEKCATRQALQTKRLEQMEHYVPELDLYLDCRSNPIFDEEGNVVQIVEQLRDVTEKKRADEALQRSEERLRALFENAPVSIIIHDKDTGEIVDANNTAYLSFGFSTLEQLKANTLWEKPPYSRADALAWIHKAASEGPQEFVWQSRKVTGEVFWEQTRLAPVTLDGTVQVLATAVDITDRVHKEQEIEYLSFHDGLTRLYNRRFFEEELQRLDVPRNLPLTLIMLDVDGLKLTNDAFGHAAGDRLLVEVAKMLRHSCRADDIVARIGGDEFAVLLPRTTEMQAQQLIKRFNQALTQKTVAALPISVSCGQGTKIGEQEKIVDVFKAAEDDMYRNKISERSSHRNQSVHLILQTLYAKTPREQEHAQGVSQLCGQIGAKIGLEKHQISELQTAGALHDIGKVVLGNDILEKQGPLSDAQWKEIKRHPEVGYSILVSVNDYASLAQWVYAHHERWDGTGYPSGLARDQIPLEARVIAIADAYEAMTNERPYQRQRSCMEALQEIEACAGSQFDPGMVQSFLQLSLPK